METIVCFILLRRHDRTFRRLFYDCDKINHLNTWRWSRSRNLPSPEMSLT